MISQKNLEKIKKITDEFFKKMDFEVEIEVKPLQEKTLPINLKMAEPKILIGEKGKTLTEIQHLLKVMIIKKIKEPIFIDLDISDYKKKKYQYLRELARSLADEVALSKKERVLSPMSAAERRIIHLELAERKDVTTESIGQEPERKIVIRPYP